MTELSAENLAGLDPTQFVRLIKSTPDAQLKATMRGERRREVLDTIVGKMSELFRPDRAEATNAVIHWHITGRPDGGTDSYQVAVAERNCEVSTSLDKDARLAVTIGGVEFLKLISGRANPALMLLTGKLRAKGDLGLATNLLNLFDFPRV